jgi:hypothetical protein
VQFLLFRYSVAAITVAGLYGAVRYRAHRFGLGLTMAIGLATWLFTWAPLERPYGLEPGTETSFDTALATTGAARGHLLDGWVVNQRNPCPAWSLFWYLVAPGNPLRTRALLPFVAAVTLVLLPGAVAWFRPKSTEDDSWLSTTCAFTAVLASSVPLDTFRPFSLFHYGLFFAAPHRAVALLLVMVAFGIAFRGGQRGPVMGGLLLGLVCFLDAGIFSWSVLVLTMTVVAGARKAATRLWMALLPAIALGALQIPMLLGSDWLRQIPAAQEVSAYRPVFRDVFAVTGDMEWVFVLALFSLPLLWKRGTTADLCILSMVGCSYAVWLGAAIVYSFHPFAEPALVFHLLRFSVALAAGVGGFELAHRLMSRWKESRLVQFSPIRFGAPAPFAFAIVVLFLLPDTAAFLWQPWKLDPLYYSSLQGWDTSVQRLERWMLENTGPDEIVLTGDETGEWIASLTGRRVWNCEKLLSPADAREHRRQLRRLFLSDDPRTMREAIGAIGADVVVLDPALREVYWQLDESLLESSDIFEKVGQIGDRYSIYRVRR